MAPAHRDLTPAPQRLAQLWVMQAMATDQFFSSRYGAISCDLDGESFTLGKVALLSRGWKYISTEWIGYAFGVLFAFILFFGALTWLMLKYVRIQLERQRARNGVNIRKEERTEGLASRLSRRSQVSRRLNSKIESNLNDRRLIIADVFDRLKQPQADQ